MLDKHINFNEMFHFLERDLSKRGTAIISIVKTEGDPENCIRLNIANTNFFSNVVRVYYEPNFAVLYSIFVLDQKQYIAKGVFDNEKVQYFFYTSEDKEGKSNSQQIVNLGFVKKLENYLQVKSM
ncbi:MAG: hypothetical protein ACRCYA_07575 [Cetobacterium sp.]|uniref:hypothetical protein n=1 Tax=Cetobacterium sp. TaxID=2071632 RepID=UPI003F2D71D5